MLGACKVAGVFSSVSSTPSHPSSLPKAQDKRKANELDASVKRLTASEAALKSEIDTLRRDLQAATAQVQQLQAAQSTSTAEKSALQQQAQQVWGRGEGGRWREKPCLFSTPHATQAAERLQQVAAELETNQKQSQSVEQLVKQLYDSVTTLHSRETHLQVGRGLVFYFRTQL